MKMIIKYLTKREDKIMKKLIIVLSVLFTLIFVGVLHGINQQSAEVETVEQVYMNQFPDPMPDVSLGPMPGFVLY